jgi:hypothetical protein
MPQCAACEGPLTDRIAFMCGEVFGDKYIESYFRCISCGGYTLEVYRDSFAGQDHVSPGILVESNVAEARIALIGRCSTPSNKHCRCPTHREYFGV